MKFDNINFDNKFYEGLGIYKIENKENFIETTKYFNGEAGLNFRKGIGSKRLDKACLILFTEQPFRVLTVTEENIIRYILKPNHRVKCQSA
jgi:hypothetical protein